MEYPIIGVGGNRFVLDCDPTLDREKALGRLELILKTPLPVRMYSQIGSSLWHDGSYYNGTLWAFIKPAYTLPPNTNYDGPMVPWSVTVTPTGDYDLLVDIGSLNPHEKISASKEGVAVRVMQNTISIYYNRSSLVKHFWNIDRNLHSVEIKGLFE